MDDTQESLAARRDLYRRRSRSSRPLLAALVLGCFCSAAEATLFSVTNLVTDDQTVNAAQTTDPQLVNAWGVSRSAGSPFWVSDNGTGVATPYTVNPATDATTKFPLVVTIPGDGSVTGQAFNAGGASNFNGDAFLFVSEDGTISGWRNALGTTAEVLQTDSPDNAYKGAALAVIGGNACICTRPTSRAHRLT